jgi:hypothetical protein
MKPSFFAWALGIAMLSLLSVTSPVSAAAILSDNFDPTIQSSQWSSIVNGAANVDCGSVSGNALKFGVADNGTAISAVSQPRSATTRSINVSGGGRISFDILIAHGDNAGFGCESADPGEDVVLEYSTDSGATWLLIDLFLYTDYPAFTMVNLRIPDGARTTATLFRWRQLSNSGGCCDNWALDNVRIDDQGGNGCQLGDGRINDFPDKDCGAPVAVYFGSIDIYAIDPITSAGTLALRITNDELTTAGVPEDGNLILEQTVNPFTGMAIVVSRLSTGEFQLNTYYADGKPYTISWDSQGKVKHLAL